MTRSEQQRQTLKERVKIGLSDALKQNGRYTDQDEMNLIVEQAKTGDFMKSIIKEALEDVWAGFDWYLYKEQNRTRPDDTERLGAIRKLYKTVEKHYHKCRADVNRIYRELNTTR